MTRSLTVHSLGQILFWSCVTSGLVLAEPEFPPVLPGGADVVSFSSDDLLTPPENLREGIAVAATPPKVDFLYYPGQDYAGNPWSVWGDGLVVGDFYYSSIGDHKGPDGNAFVYRYDSESRTLKRIVDVKRLLNLPEGHYTPGKIHSRIDLGRDGWLYFSTHRGSTRVTTPEFHYEGDWILRHDPRTGRTEIVAHAPLPMQCLPTSVLDPERMIFYAGTADGDRKRRRVQFLAYDLGGRRVLYSDDFGPRRAAIYGPVHRPGLLPSGERARRGREPGPIRSAAARSANPHRRDRRSPGGHR